jgi:hypothetical protein
METTWKNVIGFSSPYDRNPIVLHPRPSDYMELCDNNTTVKKNIDKKIYSVIYNTNTIVQEPLATPGSKSPGPLAAPSGGDDTEED